MNDQVRELLLDYNITLHEEGVLGVEHSDLEGPDVPVEDYLEHTRWMVLRMIEHPDEFDAGKLNRWLGFVQGVLWMNGNRTIQRLRDETRGICE